MSARAAIPSALTTRQAGGRRALSTVRPRRWRGLLALLTISLLIVAACDPSPYRGSPSDPLLAIVADSLVCDIERQANDRFAYEGWSPSITALGGYTVQDHEDTFRKVATTGPQVVVVALGANDIREISEGLQTYDEYRRDVRVTLEILRTVPFVVWVGVNTTNGYWGPDGDHQVVGPWINLITVVELGASGRAPGTTLYADWATESAGRMDYFVAVGNVHHSALGSAAYLDLIDRSVASFPGSPIQRSLDSMSVGPGWVRIVGWAADPDSTTTDIHLYVDDRWGGAFTADTYRPDVALAFPDFGAYRGFDVTFPVSSGAHTVCVFAINQGPDAPNPLVACREVWVPPGG